MASKKNKCKTCDYCKKVYIKFGFRYFHCKRHYCVLLNLLIGIDGGCENWQAQKNEYNLSTQRLHSVEDDIEFIYDYFNS